jgi:hypothetical protein
MEVSNNLQDLVAFIARDGDNSTYSIRGRIVGNEPGSWVIHPFV